MKILLCSVPFRPSIGGIETVSAVLAERFHALGHEVVLLTRTPGDGRDTEPYTVVRRPKALALLHWVRWADVVLHNNISLRFAWPLLLVRRPWVVAHHTWLAHGRGTPAARLKRWVLRFARNVAVSQAMACSLPVASEVVPNPFAEEVFRRLPDQARTGELIFVGRLVSDKGVDVLLLALAELRRRGIVKSLTIVGSGPEHRSLHHAVERMGLGGQVRFIGSRSAPEVAALLNAHRLAIVPSLWEEPFGLVAIEALACGCVPIVARSGGLPEAVGSFGAVFDKGDSAALADCIMRLSDEPTRVALAAGSERQLACHRPDAVARAYLRVMEHAHGIAIVDAQRA